MLAARVPKLAEIADPYNVAVVTVKFGMATTLTSETPAGPVAPAS